MSRAGTLEGTDTCACCAGHDFDIAGRGRRKECSVRARRVRRWFGLEAGCNMLQHDGYTAYVVQDPLTSWDTDLATTRDVVGRAGPCASIGHSWAGMIITKLGDRPLVRGLVYVAAFERRRIGLCRGV